MKPLNIFYILLLLLCFTADAGAQNFQPHAINYTVDQGVPSSECYGIIQDSKGVIWVGTDKGICKFDGLRFSRLTTANGLSENVVFDLFEDPKGRIWGRTFSNGVFYIENGRVVIPAFNAALVKVLGQRVVNNFCITGDDSVFMEGSSSILITAHVYSDTVTVSPETQRTIRFIQHTGFAYGRMPEGIKRPLKILYQKDSFTSDPIYFNEVLLRSAVLKNKDIIFNNIDRLYMKRAGSDRLEVIQHFKSRIISIYEDNDGGIWIGTINNGIYYYEKNLDEIPRHYFEHESVSDILQDAEGNIWLTTLKSGVYFILNKNILNIGSSKESFSVVKKIGSGHIACSKNSEVYFLNNREVIARQTYPSTLQSFNYIYDICDYDEFTVLFSGINPYLIGKYDRKYKRQYSTIYFTRGCRSNRDKRHFYLFSYGTIIKMDRSPKKENDTLSYSGSRIMDIDIDNAGNIWMGTLTGLVYYNAGANRFYPMGNGVLRSRINAIKCGPDNKIIMATDGEGVLIYDRASSGFRQITEKDGLSSNICQNLCIDGREIWVATNKGISVIKIDEHTDPLQGIRKIDKHDGLPGEEINTISIDSQRVWVASNSGVTWFDRNMVSENRLAPRVYFEYARTNQNLYVVQDGDHVLNHDENYLELNFYGISYKSLRKLKYKYRLKGADGNWHYTFQSRITYPSLSPGTYSFELYAINNDGMSSIVPVLFSFEINPPFWQRWIFITGMACVLSGLVFLAFYYRLKALRKREWEKNYYNNRMLESEMRALKAQMNPHFIFNAVASIQNFIISNDLKAANKYLVKFSRLIRGVLDNSHSSLIPLRKELDTLRLYIDLENLRFSNKINYEIVVEEGVDQEYFMIPPLLIQPFVENAIWHGLLPKESGCNLSIRLSIEDGKIVICIDDNGIGRVMAAQARMKTEKRRSLGMEMTENRITALQKIHRVSLRFAIIDKVDALQEPAGTMVVITLPVIK